MMMTLSDRERNRLNLLARALEGLHRHDAMPCPKCEKLTRPLVENGRFYRCYCTGMVSPVMWHSEA